jgi:hypothetical protein
MKLSQLESKFPCECGHAEQRHGSISGRAFCCGCMDDYANSKIGVYILHEFRADNLRYLEQKDNEKTQ